MKIRTLSKAIVELKKEDKDCELTLTALRRMVRTKKLPSERVGTKYLVDIDLLKNILFNKNQD